MLIRTPTRREFLKYSGLGLGTAVAYRAKPQVLEGILAAGGNSVTARSFNGTSEYLSNLTNYFAGSTGPFTIAFWAKLTSGSSTSQYILQMGSGNQWAVIYGFSTGNIEFFQNGGSGTPRTSSQITVPDNNWHHYCYRYNGAASTWDYFLDGVKHSINPTITFSAGTNAGGLAVMAASGGTTFCAGSLCRVYLSTGFLTDPEVALLAGSTCSSAGAPAGNVGYWLIGGVNSPELDSSGNSHSLTLHGTCAQVAGPVCSSS